CGPLNLLCAYATSVRDVALPTGSVIRVAEVHESDATYAVPHGADPRRRTPRCGDDPRRLRPRGNWTAQENRTSLPGLIDSREHDARATALHRLRNRRGRRERLRVRAA